jgi:hypothetical protein
MNAWTHIHTHKQQQRCCLAPDAASIVNESDHTCCCTASCAVLRHALTVLAAREPGFTVLKALCGRLQHTLPLTHRSLHNEGCTAFLSGSGEPLVGFLCVSAVFRNVGALSWRAMPLWWRTAVCDLHPPPSNCQTRACWITGSQLAACDPALP